MYARIGVLGGGGGGRRAITYAAASGTASKSGTAPISAAPLRRRLFTPIPTHAIARYTPPGLTTRYASLGCAHHVRTRGLATLAAAATEPAQTAPTSSGSGSGSAGSDAGRRSSSQTVLLVVGGAAVCLYLWSQARVSGEGALAPPLPSAARIASSHAAPGVDDPLALDKLPSLIKEHHALPFWRRLWFYARLACRAALLSTVWVPVLLSGLVLPQDTWMRMVVRLAERCGAVFIKLAQWAATRPDLFPDEVCEHLSKLQAEVRPHKYARSLEACRDNFGPDLTAPDGSRLVLSEEVLGSGSMGQVHRGSIISADGTTRTEVAVKVLHPHIHSRVNLDLTLLYFVAAAITKIPYSELQWVSLPEMLIQFTEFMGSHLNLVQEAENMRRFQYNFRKNPNIQFPSPRYPFVGEQVMVQELAHGIPLSQFLHSQEYSVRREKQSMLLRLKNRAMRHKMEKKQREAEEEHQRLHAGNPDAPPPPPPPSSHLASSPLHTEIARLGLQMYLHMLIEDNFVHSDLHPGNLMVAFPSEGPLQGEGNPVQRYDNMSSEHLKSEHVALVVLDSGLVSVLTPRNRRNFLSLFGALILRDGRLAARLMLDNAPKHSCSDPQALQDDMHTIVSAIPLENLASVDLGRLLSEVMNCVRRHHVKLESDFASLVISLAIIEGIGRQLDPGLSLFHQAVPVMLKNRDCRRILVETAGLKACIKMGLAVAKDELHMLTHKDKDKQPQQH